MDAGKQVNEHIRALPKEAAEMFASRVAIQLERGAFETAHAVIDEAEASVVETTPALTDQEFRQWPMARLDVHPKIINSMESIGCLFVGDAIDMRDEEILTIPNFGERSLKSLRSAIEKQRPRHRYQPSKGGRAGNVRTTRATFSTGNRRNVE